MKLSVAHFEENSHIVLHFRKQIFHVIYLAFDLIWMDWNTNYIFIKMYTAIFYALILLILQYSWQPSCQCCIEKKTHFFTEYNEIITHAFRRINVLIRLNLIQINQKRNYNSWFKHRCNMRNVSFFNGYFIYISFPSKATNKETLQNTQYEL